MLSYLRDPNQELPAENEQAENEQQQEQEILTVATKEKDVRRSTTILGALFIIGLICLGVMIKKSAPQAAAAQQTVDNEEIEMERAIVEITGIRKDMLTQMDEIVSKFYEFSDVFQVQVSELVKNPFELESFIKGLEQNAEGDTPEIDANMILREEIRLKAKNLKLYSVMQSQKGVCCMINNKIFYEGGVIDDFVVKKISDNSVLLDMSGVEITLTIIK